MALHSPKGFKNGCDVIVGSLLNYSHSIFEGLGPNKDHYTVYWWNGPYAKLFKIINFKGAGGPMFKTCYHGHVHNSTARAYINSCGQFIHS